MTIRILVLGCLCAFSLCGQRQKFYWQDACFKNPAAPFCPGHEYAVKKVKPTKDGAGRGDGTGTRLLPSTPDKVTPSVIAVGSIDWRFADPLADGLVGFNAAKLSASPVARSLIARLGSSQGVSDTDVQKIFEGLSSVEQVALCTRENRVVMMVTGRGMDSTLPALQTGWKAVPVLGNAMLVGDSEAVDQAVQRLATETPLSELTRAAEQQHATGEFWAVGSARLLGPQPVTAGAKLFSLTASMKDRLTSEGAVEFNGVPDATTLRMWPAAPGGVNIDGNIAHVSIAMEAGEVDQRFEEIAASPLGQRLKDLIHVARYLPARSMTTVRTKPMIYGLDDGPKEVSQYSQR